MLHRLVSGSGDIKTTKDGKVLLSEMVRPPAPARSQFPRRPRPLAVSTQSPPTRSSHAVPARSQFPRSARPLAVSKCPPARSFHAPLLVRPHQRSLGRVFLANLQQIMNPTAGLIARAAAAQDDATGDGTTTNVLLIAELMKQANRFLSEGLHPRVVTEGFELAKREAVKVRPCAPKERPSAAALFFSKQMRPRPPCRLHTTSQFLDTYKRPVTVDRELLIQVARTALRTKVLPGTALGVCLFGDCADCDPFRLCLISTLRTAAARGRRQPHRGRRRCGADHSAARRKDRPVHGRDPKDDAQDRVGHPGPCSERGRAGNGAGKRAGNGAGKGRLVGQGVGERGCGEKRAPGGLRGCAVARDLVAHSPACRLANSGVHSWSRASSWTTVRGTLTCRSALRTPSFCRATCRWNTRKGTTSPVVPP